jgi:NAD(P)-dependent dehydrogenase (short-subunit alcohol dehydrogenase family)
MAQTESLATAGAFSGRHVVVTGGSGGLGGAVVAAFLDAGATVHVPNAEPKLRGPLTAIASERLVVANGVDLTDEAHVARFYAARPSLWASIQLAGGFGAKPIAETSLADVRAMHDLNLVTCFLACREAVSAMRARPTPGAPGGRLVNVAARPALTPAGGMLAYSTSKAAVASFTQCLAAEVLAERILVNAVVPSIIDTPANRASMPKADHDAWPKATEIARTIVWLASEGNALTSGTLVPVFGRA